MKKLIIGLFLFAVFTGIVYANPDDNGWLGRRPNWTRDRLTYPVQEGVNLIMRRLDNYASSYYAIEVVASSGNVKAEVFGTITISASSGVASVTVYGSTNTITVKTVPYDYNMFYPTTTVSVITNTAGTTVTIPYECNFIGFTASGSTGTVITNFGNIQLPNGIPINIPLPYYITPTLIFTGLTPQATYYYITTGRVTK